MHYKKILYIILIFISFLFSQSQFNYDYGEDILYGDARSIGIGNTFFTTGTSSGVVSVNPARLFNIASLDSRKFILDFQLDAITFSERRSIKMIDTFDETFGYPDYVYNLHSNYNFSFGFVYAINFNKNFGGIGLGLSRRPYRSFNYTYEEEVRGKASYPDGFVGIKDPLMGYQIFRTSGTLFVESLGLSYSSPLIEDIAIGLSLNKISSTNKIKKQYIDTLYNTMDEFIEYNFDEFDNTTIIEKVKESFFYTVSMEIPHKFITYALGYESSDMFGDKKSFGMRVKHNKNMLLSFEINSKSFDIYNTHNNYTYINEDVEEFKIGFEYISKKGIPIRAGLSWKENIDIRHKPIATLMLGTRKSIGDFVLDFGINYYLVKNQQDRLFESIVPPDSNPYGDYVTESRLSIVTTFKWSF